MQKNPKGKTIPRKPGRRISMSAAGVTGAKPVPKDMLMSAWWVGFAGGNIPGAETMMKQVDKSLSQGMATSPEISADIRRQNR